MSGFPAAYWFTQKSLGKWTRVLDKSEDEKSEPSPTKSAASTTPPQTAQTSTSTNSSSTNSLSKVIIKFKHP